MTNEQIIEQIKSGYSVTDNMQMLYEKSSVNQKDHKTLFCI